MHGFHYFYSPTEKLVNAEHIRRHRNLPSPRVREQLPRGPPGCPIRDKAAVNTTIGFFFINQENSKWSYVSLPQVMKGKVLANFW
jgi:hypothetical protein